MSEKCTWSAGQGVCVKPAVKDGLCAEHHVKYEPKPGTSTFDYSQGDFRSIDPKLEAAMAEIDSVLQKYQIAGNVVLASSTHARFLTAFPEWSAIKFLRQGEDLLMRIKWKKDDGVPLLESSCHLYFRTLDILLQQCQVVMGMVDKIHESLEANGIEMDHKHHDEVDDETPST